MYTVESIEKLETVYSILRERNPGKKIKVVYDFNKKTYDLLLTNEKYTNDPEVPLDLSMKVVYGDSVVKGTPILVKFDTGLITVKSIEDIYTNYTATLFGKEEADGIGSSKVQVYTKGKWCDIKKVIRHNTDKVMYRVSNQNGTVVVTEDHSLMTSTSKQIKPNECNFYTELMISYPTEFCTKFDVSSGEAYVFGVLVKHLFWDTGKIELDIHDYNEFSKNFCVMFEGINKIETTSISNRTTMSLDKTFIGHFYDMSNGILHADGNAKIPDSILNGSQSSIISFLSAFMRGDVSDGFTLKSNNQIQCAGFYHILTKLDYKVNVIDSVTLFACDSLFPVPLIVEKLGGAKNDFVYDIETTSGMFQAGIGRFIVKNTDSIFIEMKYNRDDYNLNRHDTFKIAGLCGNKLTNEVFNRKPIEMEFEKVFQPFILLTKKRYIGKKFEDLKNPLKMKEISAAGIALTRRDYCGYVKKCYKDVIDKIVNDSDVMAGINVLKDYIENLSHYNIDIDDLVLSAQLAREYKTTPVHVVLAKKLKERQQEVQVGDRIPYIFIEANVPGLKKSELGEDPGYAKEHSLKINRECYLEQLVKPILGFFKVVLKDDDNLFQELLEYVNGMALKFGGKKFKNSDFVLPSTE